ncbi:hypothetical protein [Pseudomonas sp. BN515]|uniref:hypothetical protein n=1 Tax=Pseudomonas sp. BN515 TaxID=2567892 RepID=UPI002457AB9F|nr:hypothetical protein [Pseudomonas sp. BN515]
MAGIFRRNLKQLDAGGWRGGSIHLSIITIFYGFEALNDYCYSRERRQKRPGFGVFAISATPTAATLSGRKAVRQKIRRNGREFSEIKALSHDA